MSFLQDELSELKKAVSGNYLLQFAKKDDVGLVLSATSLLDQYIGLAVVIRFPVELTAQTYARIFAPSAPLGAFSAKISLASALGLVIGDMGNDLAILRKLRNIYAHSILPPPLSEQRIAQRCASLKLTQGLSDELKAACGTEQRQRIIEVTARIILYLTIIIQRALAERTVGQRYSGEISTEMKRLLAEMNINPESPAPTT